jgi:hypothetical protein
MILGLKLLLAHIIGDFVLQPQKWVDHKIRNKHTSVYLYAHMAVHTAVLLSVLAFDFAYWPAIVFIIITHYIFDLVKLYLQNTFNPRFLFFADQAAHILVIVLVTLHYAPQTFQIESISTPGFILFITAILMITSVCSVLMKVFISQWELPDENANESLKNAGKYIGILERLFVFTFVVMGLWQAIGFLIAAKSIFRFGDLSKAKDRKLTEYVLIGTLLSFGMAVIIGMGYVFLHPLIH